MKTKKYPQLCHFVAGLLFLLLSSKLFEEHLSSSIVILSIGVIAVAVAGVYAWLRKKTGKTVHAILLLESGGFAYMAWLQNNQHHAGVFMYVYAALAITYIVLLVLFILMNEHTHHHTRHKKHKRHYKKASTEQRADNSHRAALYIADDVKKDSN